MNLRLDWCSHDVAKYACQNFHYARKMVTGATIKIGVWENGKFIGCVIYGKGANNNALKKYGLKSWEGCELMRVALKEHTTPVTKILRISRVLLFQKAPKLKIIVSYADPEQSHKGIIYQADNWVYEGLTDRVDYYIDKKGVELHWRKARYAQKRGEILQMFYKPGKHKYIYPLDKKWYKDYMRQSSKSKMASYHEAQDGAVPILTHQEANE